MSEPLGGLLSAPPALVAALAAVRAARDAPLIMADCFTLTLRTGTVLTLTNADVPVTLGGTTFLANSILIDGLGFKCALGLDVDDVQGLGPAELGHSSCAHAS